jgi:ABC-type sugar transport system substrate-binding protein
MIRRHRRPARALARALAAAAASAVAAAEAQDEWRSAVAPFTYHWRYNAEHKPVWALGVERQRADGRARSFETLRLQFCRSPHDVGDQQMQAPLAILQAPARKQRITIEDHGVLAFCDGQREQRSNEAPPQTDEW